MADAAAAAEAEADAEAAAAAALIDNDDVLLVVLASLMSDFLD